MDFRHWPQWPGLNLNATSGADAIYPDLYPDIVSSTPFITWDFLMFELRIWMKRLILHFIVI